MRLEDVHSPEDIKDLSWEELTDLAGQIRSEIVSTVSHRGGHLASNLGVVELTLALHRVFDMPEDKIVFDVGHQSYVHKLLTGRYWRFRTLRSFGGLAGFPKKSESPYDVFETGHSSTAISAALGLARARDLQGKTHQVVALVGDGALTGGMCYEALNDAGNAETRMIVILNDNEMSISPNVGGLSRHLTDLRVSKGWWSTKRRVRRLEKVPVIGKPLYRFIHLSKSFVKSWFVDEGFFSALGFHYYGPIDGHDLKSMEHTFRLARESEGPVVIHVLTHKGYGYEKAEEHPEQFHGTPPFYVETGDARKAKKLPGYGEVMGEELAELAQKDPRVVAVSAAMTGGTGLTAFQKRFPERMFDVGIAEGHAVTMAAGLATGGMRPYFAVYATFFQRGYDQMIHDVAMQGLPVVFLLDRAGLVGEDGATHHGVFDLAAMLPVPGMTILAPRDLQELRLMMRWTIDAPGPVAIRYGRHPEDMEADYPCKRFSVGKWEPLERGKDCALFCIGSMNPIGAEMHRLLRAKGIEAAVINCSTVKPLDLELLHCMTDRPWFTLEEHLLSGGFGDAVTAACREQSWPAPAACFGIPETFVQHGSRRQLLKYLGLDAEQLTERVAAILKDRS